MSWPGNTFAFQRVWGPKPKYERVLSYYKNEQPFTIISGPCSVESEEQINTIAKYVAAAGATHLRGGVFRAGTYPGDKFGWIDPKLIKAYYDAAKANNLKNIIEVIDYRDLDKIAMFTDCFQVGCRQMQNYTLLREVGKSGKTVFLKRHPGSTIDEFLGAAEHVLAGGCTRLYLIERGSATNATHVRWDLSISIIPAIKMLTRLPILVDASHGTGRRDLVAPMTLAGIAAGADGCLIETHPSPVDSLSDADQAIGRISYEELMKKITELRKVL